MRTALRVGLALCVAGCGGDSTTSVGDAGGDGAVRADTGRDVGSTDTGADDAAVVLPFEVGPPEIPWLEDGEPVVAPPVLTPCQEGWSESELAGVPVCEPWSRGGAQDCPPGEAHLIGAEGCAPLGGPCPTGDFADDLKAMRPVVYVRRGEPAGGDGTLGSPYGTLAAALAAGLPEGTIVALGKGSYVGAVVPAGITLWGACPSETLVTTPPGGPYALEIPAGAVEVRRLRVEPGDGGGISATGAGTAVSLQAVEVRGATCYGVRVVDEAVLDADGLVLRGTRPCDDPATASEALSVWGATARVRGSLLARNADWGIRVDANLDHDTAAELLLEDSVVRNHEATFPGVHAFAGGHSAEDGTTAPTHGTVRRSIFEGNRGGGIGFAGARTTGEVEQILIRDSGSAQGVSAAVVAQPVSVFNGASLHLARSTIAGTVSSLNRGAVHVVRARAFTAEDVVLVGNKARALSVFQVEGSAWARRLRAAGNVAGDVFVFDTATFELEDARVGENTLQGWVGGEEGAVAISLLAQAEHEPTHLAVRRATVADAAGLGIGANFRGATITLEDVSIRRTRPVSGGGNGIVGAFDASITARRVMLEQSSTAAIQFTNGAGSLVLEDAWIRDTRPFPGQEVGGRGIVLPQGSTATVRRTRIEGSHELGVVGFGSTMLLEDVEVRRTRRAGCAGGGFCLEHGHALGAYGGTTLEATRFVLADTASCGVHLATGAEVDLSDGLVTRSRIGACIQVDGYDPSRLSRGVYFIDNEQNLQATELPVPDVGD